LGLKDSREVYLDAWPPVAWAAGKNHAFCRRQRSWCPTNAVWATGRSPRRAPSEAGRRKKAP